jgi:hypothetical protein
MGFDNDFLAADEMVRVKRIVEDPRGREWSESALQLAVPGKAWHA